MKKLLYGTLGCALLGLSLSAVADDSMMMKHDQAMVKAMDTNNDGKISKEEFMAYHEKMWDSMKKDSNGMVDAKSMMMMHHDSMMKGKDTSGDSMSH
jgi:EF-hand domain pair